MFSLGSHQSRIVCTRTIKERQAAHVDIPAACRSELREALLEGGIDKLYSHQAEVFDHVQAGKNVVLTTGTASGKTLAYLLPILNCLLGNTARRAILLFPTKALAQDQLRGLVRLIHRIGGKGLRAGVYDGDTPPSERREIREKANLILTNPDMLNAGFLPNHARRGFSHLFRNVDFVVVDELHTYRGAFGAHFANVMRRLRRLCSHYRSQPQFLCTSATIANPQELAERIFGLPFELCERDGSPSAEKVVHFWQPPRSAEGVGRSVVKEMVRFVPFLVEKRHRFIVFCRSRKETEVVLKESRDALSSVGGGHNESNLIAAYRGGYTPQERRQVEQELIGGDILGVVSTNALELGVDIGSLEIVVQGGFPGTRASFWQQIGRAGRRGSQAHAVVMLAMNPMDQYISINPDWLVDGRSESAVVDPDNLTIQLAHIRAAAAELPLTLDDLGTFPDLGEVVPLLQQAKEVREVYGAYHWCGGTYPAGDFSLRNLDGDRFKIVNRVSGSTLTEMDRPQTYKEAYPKAIYLHDGIQYMVETLDLVGHVATVVPVEQDYYTEPDVRMSIDVLLVHEKKELDLVGAYFGDVIVHATTVGYKMLQFHNHQNLGYEVLQEPLTIKLETEALWIQVPPFVLEVLGEQATDYTVGMLHSIASVARMTTMAERSDLCGTSFHYTDEEGGQTMNALILYDSHHGGLGYAAKGFERVDSLLEQALALVEGCSCKEGCPACVGDFLLDKALVVWALSCFFERLAPPKGRGLQRRSSSPSSDDSPDGNAGRVDAPSPIGFAQVVPCWDGLLDRMALTNSWGHGFFTTVSHPQVFGENKLILFLHSPGMLKWAQEEENKKRLLATLSRHVLLPSPFSLEFQLGEGAEERASKTSFKLKRRYDDLKG